MAVREADGDSTSYFRAKPEPQAGTSPNIQTAFSDMSDAQLGFYVRAAKTWEDGKVPDRFSPWSSWGGEHTARATARTNADNAQRELDRRATAK